MSSMGQGDRVGEVVRQLRSKDAQLSLYDAVQQAQEIVDRETSYVRERSGEAVRMSRGARTMNDRQCELLCSAQYGQLALETRLEADRLADVAGRRAQRG